MSEMKSSRFTEDVTTEPEIVSLTSATGAEAIRKDVNKDASISDKFGRKITIIAMSCSALACYLLFILSGMFKWTPYLTGFAIGGFMGSYWGAGDTIGGIMFSESSPTNLRSSVTVINTLLNGVMGGLATVVTMILLPIIPEKMFGYMYLGLTVPGLVGAIVIMWLFVGETRGLDLKTVTGTEWDKPKKIKEETQDGE